jgi:hypothetical protein
MSSTGIWLFTISWNEERMLPFFFRHYDRWVDRYIIHDDGSTDRTLEMFAARPNVQVLRFERHVAGSFVASATLLQNHAWKVARGNAAWTVITAIDEHLHHPDIVGYLARCRQQGVSAIPALGFQMLTDRFPESTEWLAETQRSGAPYDMMNKLSIFQPDMLEETNYAPGRHSAAPQGRVVYPKADELLNLHYKYLGVDYVRSRHSLLLSGLGERDREAGLGEHYSRSPAELDLELRHFASEALDYRDPAVGFTTHLERWWRRSRLRA